MSRAADIPVDSDERRLRAAAREAARPLSGV